jgi:hypothetical protein
VIKVSLRLFDECTFFPLTCWQDSLSHFPNEIIWISSVVIARKITSSLIVFSRETIFSLVPNVRFHVVIGSVRIPFWTPEVVGSTPGQTHSSCDREGDSPWRRRFSRGLRFPLTFTEVATKPQASHRPTLIVTGGSWRKSAPRENAGYLACIYPWRMNTSIRPSSQVGNLASISFVWHTKQYSNIEYRWQTYVYRCRRAQ